jgi:hypothetical protein
MAVFEQLGRMTYISANGNQHILYPVTKKECIDGLVDYDYIIGDVIDLETTNKTNIVAAINEIVQNMTNSSGTSIDSQLISQLINDALSEAKNKGEFDGKDGRGIVSINRTSGNGSAGSVDVYTILFTDSTTSTFTVYNGMNGTGTGGAAGNGATFTPSLDSDGNLSWTNDKNLPNPTTVNIKGKDGIPGRGIVSINKTSGNGAAGTSDIYTITYTDNTTSTFAVYNGANGTGTGGSGGSGADGATFTPYVDSSGNLSWTNDKGLGNPDSVNIKGEPGVTPERGVHYWTSEDIAEIKRYVDEAILGGEW